MSTKHYPGLSDAEVEASRKEHGSNVLTPPARTPLWKLFLEKFKDPIIQILLVAALLSLVVSIVNNEYAETIGIFVAIFLSTGVGFWFEMDANRKFELLNQVNDDVPVKVFRNGGIHEVARKDIVVGDIVVLGTGDEIPADGVLLEAVALQVNESTLTGEPSIDKTTDPAAFDKEATYPSNKVMRGTNVINGHGIYRVESVGDATEFGRVAEKSTEINNDKTPLSKQLEGLAKLISIIGFVVAGLVFFGLLVKDIVGGEFADGNLFTLETAGRVLNYFMVAVTLIVVSVPEGLPMSVTLSLALSMRKMLKTNNLVRKMHACETMGATTVVCTDKTGTLTQNKMQVYRADFYALDGGDWQADSETGVLIGEGISVNSTAYLDAANPADVKPLGNPTEGALLLWLREHGVDYEKYRENTRLLGQIAFSTERKYMATVAVSALGNRQVLYVKGAPEIVFSKCSGVLTADGVVAADSYRGRVEEELLGYQRQAMRTLGFAYKVLDSFDGDMDAVVAGGLTFLGIAAISDPVRPDVPAAVEKCLNAGVDIKIVTGDTPATAREIGRQIGIWKDDYTDDNIITGPAFEQLSDEEALARVTSLKIMCRARPTDKQRLVKLLKQTGAVVAVTGDGTNDAPALNHADVGLSMGSGTSVAKEASDITLLDDSFNSIATAIMWGRSLYHNIQRFILFQLTINLTALLVVLIGALFGQEMPLTVTQMLWVNMIIDTFAAAALASLPPDPKVMNEKPRRQGDFIIGRAMWRTIIGVGAVFTVLLLGMMYWMGHNGDGMSPYELSVFFTVFVFLQFWNMFNARAYLTHGSAFSKLGACKGLIAVMFIIPIGQLLIVQFGGEMFRTVPLSFRDWCIIIAGTSLVLWIGELFRLFKGRSR